MKYAFKDYDNKKFYNSKKWRKVSQAYLASQNYLCERCGNPAVICHHKIWLNGTNVHDPNIAYNWDNLEALCIDCHNKEHHAERDDEVIFNSQGDVVGVKSIERRKFEAEIKKLDKAIEAIQERRRATQKAQPTDRPTTHTEHATEPARKHSGGAKGEGE